VPGHVFVSYSVVDEVYVRRLVRHLRSSGVEVWLDAEGRADGESPVEGEMRWEHVVAEKVDTCAALVAVMTPESGRSESVEREVARARDSHRPILPLLLAGRPVLDLPGDEYEDVVGRRMPAPGFVARLRELAPGPEPVAPPAEGSAGSSPAPPADGNPPAPADGVSALTGGPSRLRAALRGLLPLRSRSRAAPTPPADGPQ
jgi:TIR domain-containing protein